MSMVADRTWHQLTVQASLEALGVDPSRGLTTQEAAERSSAQGPNELVELGRRSILSIIWDQLRGALIALLIAAAVVSAAVGDVQDAAAILAIVFFFIYLRKC